MRTIIEDNVNHTKTFYDGAIILWDKIAMLYFIIVMSYILFDANRNGLEQDLYAANGVRFSHPEIYMLLRLKCQK